MVNETGLTKEEINYWLFELTEDQMAEDIIGEANSNYYADCIKR
ncbi:MULTISPECIES: hypothetical protein [Methanobacterium]|nr:MULTISPECIES: hypothetical protein [Methanobacterium]